MKTLAVLVASVLVSTLCLRAGEVQGDYRSSTATDRSAHWDTSPEHWDEVIRQQQSSNVLKLGRSDFALSGPLVTGFRRQRVHADQSLGQKIIGLPIVNLFVPQRMAKPPGGEGRYFAWRSSDRPWSSTTPAGPAGGAFNPIDNDPKAGLISIGW